MTRLAAVIGLEARLQRRYGLWTAFVAVTTVWVALLRALPAPVRPTAAPLVLVFEAVVVGLLPAGALTLFERAERVPGPLAVTPLRAVERLAARVGLLTLATLLMTAVIVVTAGVGPAGVRPDPLTLLAGLVPGTVLVLCVALVVAPRFRSLTDYVLGVQVPLLPLGLPVLPLLGVGASPLWWLLPTHATFTLIAGAYRGATVATVAGGLAVQLAWIAVLAPRAARALRRAAEQDG